jgi:hypothetical protein
MPVEFLIETGYFAHLQWFSGDFEIGGGEGQSGVF